MKRKTPYNVILISVDAVSKEDEQRLLQLPVFKYLKENGTYCNNMTTVFPTITYPIHTSAITGVYPDRHKINHNEPWQADVPEDLRRWYWAVNEIGAKTLWKAAAEKGLKTASLLWPVSGKGTGAIRWDFPECMPLRGENPVIKYFKYATKSWLAYTELKWGAKVRKSIKRNDLDDYCCFLVERLLEKKRVPELITVHFADTDFSRHDHGVGSSEDERAMLHTNDMLQRIMDGVRKRGLEEDTVFVVMSDHGQENVDHGYIALDSVLCDAGIGRAQSIGMGAYVYADNEQDAIRYLEEHKNELHIEKILCNEELRKMHAPKDISLAIQAETGYGYSDRNCECNHVGDHGFGVDHPTAKALLWLCGKPFEKGAEIDSARIVDIAPTIADIMQLSMPDCDGTVIKHK